MIINRKIESELLSWKDTENRKPVKLVGLLKEIQKEKELLLKLKYSEEKFKSLVTLLPEAVYEADLKGNITYVNSQ